MNAPTPEVKWVPPETSIYVLPLLPEIRGEEHREKVNAFVVTLLTVACTVLALFDLFLLASSL